MFQEEPKTILLVDDEADLLVLTKKVLEHREYRVFTALNPLIALETLRSEKIDLIISDLRMPEMDGLSFHQEVRRRWPGIGFILITGYWMSSRKALEEAESLFGILKKPFGSGELVDLAAKFFQDRR